MKNNKRNGADGQINFNDSLAPDKRSKIPKNYKRKALLAAVSLCVLLTLTISVVFSTSDPLITESYLNDVFFNQVKEYIDNNTVVAAGDSFRVVSVAKGQKFIGGAGCEFILRQGSGNVIASSLGGLSDVTAGVDIGEFNKLPPNHHLIISRDDGRGFLATDDVLILVKGSYKLE